MFKKYRFAISKGGFTHFVVVEAQGRFEAERNAKMQYSDASSIVFNGEIIDYSSQIIWRTEESFVYLSI